MKVNSFEDITMDMISKSKSIKELESYKSTLNSSLSSSSKGFMIFIMSFISLFMIFMGGFLIFEIGFFLQYKGEHTKYAILMCFVALFTFLFLGIKSMISNYKYWRKCYDNREDTKHFIKQINKQIEKLNNKIKLELSTLSTITKNYLKEKEI